MSHINYDLKFTAEASPYLDDFTLGFLFACHEDLDKYEQFQEIPSTNEDISYLSVILMRKDCLEVQNKTKIILEKAKDFGVSFNQLGYDYWQIRNNKDYYYLQSLPNEIKEEIFNLFKIYGKPCHMTQNKEGNFIFQYKDYQLHLQKENELIDLYSFISNKKNKIEDVKEFSYKNKPNNVKSNLTSP